MIYVVYFVLGIIALAIVGIYNFIVDSKFLIAICVALSGILFLLFKIYENYYFNSKNFNKVKAGIKKYIDNCNELNHHIAELKGAFLNIRAYDFGEGTLQDESSYNFKRKEWSIDTKNDHVHNCSSSVCKNASNQPFKYLCKYFDINKDEESLSQIEGVLNDFSAAEEGKILLQKEKAEILDGITGSIPWVVETFLKKRLISELGFEDVDMSDLYFPVYTFLYVSPGGNSSFRFDIKLDLENLEKLIRYIKDLVKFRKSISGQRALMTQTLREKIKKRDNYTCQICGISIFDEKNLLLEIDHIKPLSKGGITTEANLQTLCWKCNRSKGSKLVLN